MSADPWISGMVEEGERRATAELAPASERVLALIPEIYHGAVRALVGTAIATGQNAAFEVLAEQGWFRPELGDPA